MMKQPLAYVHPDAKVEDNVVIEPFVTIDQDVVIGEGTRIGSGVTILPGTRIGKNCKIFPGAVIGAIPQDLKFRGEYSTVEIGDNNTIREFVTINRGTAAKGKTVVGNNNLIMAYVHIAHDCHVGNNCILVNNTQLAGEVIIDDFVILAGMVAVHQFLRLLKPDANHLRMLELIQLASVAETIPTKKFVKFRIFTATFIRKD
jgi:UDP-N-acetylglucosamine acyltransferase